MIDRNAAKFIAAAGLVAIGGNTANAGGEVGAPTRDDTRATRVLAEGQHARKAAQPVAKPAAKPVAKPVTRQADAAKAAVRAVGSTQVIAGQSRQAKTAAPSANARRVVITSSNSAMRDKATQPAPRVQQRVNAAAPAIAQAPVALPKANAAASGKVVTRSSAQLAQSRSVTRSSDTMRESRTVGLTSKQIREGREVTRSSQQMRENAPKPTRVSTQRASAEKLDVSGVRDVTPRRIVIRSANARG